MHASLIGINCTASTKPPQVAPPPNPRDSAGMSFRALYRHGFARVAACTIRTAIADPEARAHLPRSVALP